MLFAMESKELKFSESLEEQEVQTVQPLSIDTVHGGQLKRSNRRSHLLK